MSNRAKHIGEIMMTTPIFPSIHEYGIFYNGPIGAVKREYQSDFRADYGLPEDDMKTRIVADLDVFEDERDVEYDHTDSYMWEDLKKDIFHKPYSHYLEYSTCVNWQNREGYRFRTFQNALEYSYECSMDYLAHGNKKKTFKVFFFYLNRMINLGLIKTINKLITQLNLKQLILAPPIALRSQNLVESIELLIRPIHLGKRV